MAFVQTTTKFTGSSSGGYVTPALTTTAGNFAVLTLAHFNATNSAAPTFTDSKGNTTAVDITRVETVLTKSRACVGSVQLTSGGASHTWTLSMLASSYSEGNVSEYSGIATSSAFDQSGNAQANPVSVTSITPTSGTTTQADELVIGCVITNQNSTNTHISDPPTGYTSIGVEPNDTVIIGYEAAYKIVAATGAQAPTWNFDAAAGGGNAAVVATYKAAAAASDTLMAQACL